MFEYVWSRVYPSNITMLAFCLFMACFRFACEAGARASSASVWYESGEGRDGWCDVRRAMRVLCFDGGLSVVVTPNTTLAPLFEKPIRICKNRSWKRKGVAGFI